MKFTIKYIFFISLLSFLFSCTDKKLNDELAVINDAFMTVTDTVAYYELSLRPPPPPDYFENNMIVHYSNPKYKHLAIVVPDTLYSFTDDIWTSTISLFCKGWGNDEKPGMIELKKEMCKTIEKGTAPQKFNINHLKHIGRYILTKINSGVKLDIPIVGKIQFSQVVINNDKSFAVFAARIFDTRKSGIEKLYFLEKDNEKWKVIKTEILSIY